VRHVDLEVALRGERADGDPDGRVIGGQIGLAPTASTVEVPVLGRREDMELLAAIGGVAVADDTEVLEDVERPVHRRRDGPRIEGATAVDQLGAGDVAVRVRQHLYEDPALRGPAQPTGSQSTGDVIPGRRGVE